MLPIEFLLAVEIAMTLYVLWMLNIVPRFDTIQIPIIINDDTYEEVSSENAIEKSNGLLDEKVVTWLWVDIVYSGEIYDVRGLK